MKWNDIKESKPETYKDVVVKDEYIADSRNVYDSYAIAYTDDKGMWHASIEMLRAPTLLGDAHIELDGNVTHWASLGEEE